MEGYTVFNAELRRAVFAGIDGRSYDFKNPTIYCVHTKSDGTVQLSKSNGHFVVWDGTEYPYGSFCVKADDFKSIHWNSIEDAKKWLNARKI